MMNPLDYAFEDLSSNLPLPPKKIAKNISLMEKDRDPLEAYGRQNSNLRKSFNRESRATSESSVDLGPRMADNELKGAVTLIEGIPRARVLKKYSVRSRASSILMKVGFA